MAYDYSGTKAVWAARLGTTPKKVWTATFLCRNLTSRTALESSQLERLKMQFQQDWPKDKINFLPENLEKVRSTELYGAPLEGSTIFLKRISSCYMSMESYQLAELKYAFFSITGRKTKKVPRSKLFLWTVFKHGLLEGSTILHQYSAITRTPLESSRLGEL